MRNVKSSVEYLGGLGFLCFCAVVALGGPAPVSRSDPSGLVIPGQQDVVKLYGSLPPSFEANEGQAERQVRFLSRTRGYHLLLTGTGALMIAHDSSGESTEIVRMEMLGSQPSPRVEGRELLPGKSNYFIGNDPSNWRIGIPHYRRVHYSDVYPGIDVVFYAARTEVEYDFVVSPGTDAGQIRLAFDVPEPLRLDAQGDLLIETSAGEFRQHKPLAYQEGEGIKQYIACNYVLQKNNQVRFELGRYDHSRPLVIDPVLRYSSYLGGEASDLGRDIAVDGSGNAYIVGQTDSLNFFTTPGAAQSLSGGTEVFVTKFNPAGTEIVYSTYLGGGSSDTNRDEGWGIAIDSSGNAYLTGSTASDTFPTTPGAFQGAEDPQRGGSDAFVTKLAPDGASLVYSTLLAGPSQDLGRGIAVDSAGNAYVTGFAGREFPTTTGAFDVDFVCCLEGFVSKLSADGSTLVYSTYLGGPDPDFGDAIAVDSSGMAYVAGYTESSNFPVTSGAFQTAFGGSADVFVAKLNATGTDLVYSTYLGGTGSDGRGSNDPGVDLTIDSTGNVYVTGPTNSSDFPTTPGAFLTAFPGSRTSFVTKLNASGAALVYSTYLGGRFEDLSFGIAVDSAGSAYVAGSTRSDDFPTTPDALQLTCGSPSPFITKINPAGDALFYSTCLGGTSGRALAVGVDPFGSAYLTGNTSDTDFPITANAPQSAASGLGDSYVAKLDSVTTLSAASFVGPRATAGSIASSFGPNLATGITVAEALPLPTELLGTSVTVTDVFGTDRPSPLFFVSPNQINFQIPAGTASGAAKITVNSGDGTVVNGAVQIEAVAPALFSANASGQGVAAGLVILVAADSSQTSISLSLFDPAEGRHVPQPVDVSAGPQGVILALFGTGISGGGTSSSVTATIGGEIADVLFVGPQGQFEGLDQVNLRLPQNLASGSHNIELTVDGKAANIVTVTIQ